MNKLFAGLVVSLYVLNAVAQTPARYEPGRIEVHSWSTWSGPGLVGHEQVIDQTSDAIGAPLLAISDTLHAQASARAHFGVLGAYAAFDQNTCAIGVACITGISYAYASWSDQLTITGGTGEGRLMISVHITGSVNGQGSAGFGIQSGQNDPGLSRLYDVSTMGSSNFRVDETLLFRKDFRYGESFNLTAGLTASVFSNSPSFARPGIVDFGNSAIVSSAVVLDPITLLQVSGASIHSLSGVDYTNISDSFATPVPEPETYALLLAGLGLLGFHASRRKLKRSA